MAKLYYVTHEDQSFEVMLPYDLAVEHDDPDVLIQYALSYMLSFGYQHIVVITGNVVVRSLRKFGDQHGNEWIENRNGDIVLDFATLKHK